MEKYTNAPVDDVEVSHEEVYTEEPKLDLYSCPTTLNNSINLNRNIGGIYHKNLNFSTINPVITNKR
tara:strand:- start:927 stop:1127 length:201 start_codon:yes stop_codon:yes gene_type:complete